MSGPANRRYLQYQSLQPVLLPKPSSAPVASAHIPARSLPALASPRHSSVPTVPSSIAPEPGGWEAPGAGNGAYADHPFPHEVDEHTAYDNGYSTDERMPDQWERDNQHNFGTHYGAHGSLYPPLDDEEDRAGSQFQHQITPQSRYGQFVNRVDRMQYGQYSGHEAHQNFDHQAYQYPDRYEAQHTNSPHHQYPTDFTPHYGQYGEQEPPEWPMQGHVRLQENSQHTGPFLEHAYGTQSLVRPTDSELRDRPRSIDGDESESSDSNESYSASYDEASDDANSEDEASLSDGSDGKDNVKGKVGRPRLGRGAVGPRPPAPLTGPIKRRLGEANSFFLDRKFVEARNKAWEIIQLNAETYEAYTLLATIYEELNDTEKSLEMRWRGCHLRPKIPDLWIDLAEEYEERGNLVRADACYRAAIRFIPYSVKARLGKARVLTRAKRFKTAVQEYEKILNKWDPLNFTATCQLVLSYLDKGDDESVQKARVLYKETFDRLRQQEDPEDMIDWDDLVKYAGIFERQGKDYAIALRELKSFARWLVGRDEQVLFDKVTENDCEWDIDDTRRLEINGFRADEFPSSTYGEGIPLELRIKLGLLRLHLGDFPEAMKHLSHFTSAISNSEITIEDYQDIYLQIADTMMKVGRPQEALEFYRPLLEIETIPDANLYFQVAMCYREIGEIHQAEKYLKSITELDPKNTKSRIELAKIYEESERLEEAHALYNEVEELQKPPPTLKKLRKRDREKLQRIREELPGNKSQKKRKGQKLPDIAYVNYVPLLPKPIPGAPVHVEKPSIWTPELDAHYSCLRRESSGMRAGNSVSRKAWKVAAKAMIECFQAHKPFYPIAPIRYRLPVAGLPSVLHNIETREWLDIFLEYALCVVRENKVEEAYATLASARRAVVFSRSREDMFLIHVAWCTCAILAGDEEACIETAISFIHEYQFTTDAYRMFAAVSRMCQCPISWYGSIKTRDVLVQQIKSMDFPLGGHQKRDFPRRLAFTAPDGKGGFVERKEMDMALLILAGHVYAASGSNTMAANYYLRAHAIEPENAMVNLCLGLTYINFALSGRPGDSQQQITLQGVTFITKYYEVRKSCPDVERRQEAHYNMARTYHMLGHTNLAVPYYNLVFKEIEGLEESEAEQKLAVDAAFNLQTIYSAVGNLRMAKAVTEKWLVL